MAPRTGGLGRARAAAATWPAALAGGRPDAWRDTWTAFRAAIASSLALEAERRTPFLWLPVALGFGVCLYFAADGEPGLTYPSVLAGAFGSAAFLARRSPVLSAVLLALAMIFLGFSAAVIRTAGFAAPSLTRTMIGPLSGFVESVEHRISGPRFVVRVDSLAGLPEAERPARVRVTLRTTSSIAPGDYVSAKARVLPPPEPARPGGYDFARDSFFRGIGGVGSILGKVEISAPPRPPDLSLRLAAGVDRARNALTDRIAHGFGGQGGAVAAALVTGKRGLISDASNDALRAAGIYHIVSISGLHMVLAAGAVFWTVRALLALSPFVAHRWPVKKIAAVLAMAGATAYCVFSGSDVATERSLIMTLVMLGAILVDRPALSLRNLAISAIIVLLREPETLLGPSFQMSYAAVAALIAFGSAWQRSRKGEAPRGPVLRLAHGLVDATVAVFVTTLLATFATAPFGIFHFQTVNPFGLLGNAMALPFVSFIVMPCAVLGTLLYPLGLDGWVWWTMGAAVEAVLRISALIQGFDGSRLVVPALGTAALLCLVAALLLATLLTTRLRALALAPLAAGLFVAAAPRKPVVVIDRDAAGAAVRGADGRLTILGKPSAFVQSQWLAADGDARPPNDPSLFEGRRCDTLGCVTRLADGRAISFLTDRAGLADDCARAVIVLLKERAGPAPCAAAVLIDRTRLERTGAAAVFASGSSFDVVTARSETGRPWERRRPPPRPTMAARSTTAAAAPSQALPAPDPDVEDTSPADSAAQ